MIRAVQILAGGRSAIVALEDVFALMGPRYFSTPGSTKISQRQFRLQLSWPRLSLELKSKCIHLQMAKQEFGEVPADTIRMAPVYWTPVSSFRRAITRRDEQIGRVCVGLVFAPEAHGVDMAYVYHCEDTSLRILLEQLVARRLTFRVEFPDIPEASYRCAPVRQAIFEFGHGRRMPGPDLVEGGKDETLAVLLQRIKTPAVSRSGLN